MAGPASSATRQKVAAKGTAGSSPTQEPEEERGWKKKMNLKDHLEPLGYDASHLAFLTQLPHKTIDRALTGQPISSMHAQKIADCISTHHGLHRNDALTPDDLDIHVVDARDLRRGARR